MNKTSKEGVYIRELSSGDIVYIITYRANNKSYKRRLGTNRDGWNVAKAYQEKLNRTKSSLYLPYEDSHTTLNEAAAKYLTNIQRKSDGKNTAGRFKNHIQGLLGERLLIDIKANDIRELRNHLSEKISSRTLE